MEKLGYSEILYELLAACKNGKYGTVYFVGSPEKGPIKIGFTTDFNNRLKALQACSPVKLEPIFTFKATANSEKILHSMFSEARSHGEWFHDSQKLNEIILELKKPMLHELEAAKRQALKILKEKMESQAQKSKS